MAYEESLRSITLDADSTIATYTGPPGVTGSANPNSGKQYCWVKVTGVHQCGLADTTANEVPIGILQNKPQNTGMAATVAISGVSKCQVGAGGVTAGQALKVDSGGKVVTATLATDAALVVGIALTTAASGKLAAVLIQPNA